MLCENSKILLDYKSERTVINKTDRLFTVLYFSVDCRDRALERSALRAAILHECQNYLGGGGGLGESEKNIFLAPFPRLP